MIKTALKIIFILISLAIASAAAGYMYFTENLKGIPDGETKEIVIPEGASGRDTAEILKESGIIRDENVFRLALRKYLPSGRIMPGRYMIDSSLSVPEIIAILEKGTVVLNLVTVPEGLTAAQIAEIFAAKGLCSADDFAAESKKEFTICGKSEDGAEGFLLPDTYDVPKEYGASEIAEMMVKSFEEYAGPIYEETKDSLPVKLSLREAVILASLVEREARVPEERPVIARVYYNRLIDGMKLECDATIQYALGKQKEVLLYSDLETESPYNTYKYPGLPPGPIANPGRASIYAVLHPAEHDYYFYVLNEIKNDGSHVFTETAAEHERAVRKYLK